jgi:hypothetical protein
MEIIIFGVVEAVEENTHTALGILAMVVVEEVAAVHQKTTLLTQDTAGQGA